SPGRSSRTRRGAGSRRVARRRPRGRARARRARAGATTRRRAARRARCVLRPGTPRPRARRKGPRVLPYQATVWLVPRTDRTGVDTEVNVVATSSTEDAHTIPALVRAAAVTFGDTPAY